MVRWTVLPALMFLVGCGDSDPVSLQPTLSPKMSAGAFVLNRGNGQPSAIDPCNFGSYLTWDVTNIQAPGGAQLLFCKFKGLPPVDRTLHVKGYECFLPGGAITYDSHFRRTPAGTASLVCRYRED